MAETLEEENKKVPVAYTICDLYKAMRMTSNSFNIYFFYYMPQDYLTSFFLLFSLQNIRNEKLWTKSVLSRIIKGRLCIPKPILLMTWLRSVRGGLVAMVHDFPRVSPRSLARGPSP